MVYTGFSAMSDFRHRLGGLRLYPHGQGRTTIFTYPVKLRDGLLSFSVSQYSFLLSFHTNRIFSWVHGCSKERLYISASLAAKCDYLS